MGVILSSCRSPARVLPTSRTTRTASQLPAPELAYILGGAGVGKSTWIIDNSLALTHQIIDPDRLAGLCPIEDDDPAGVSSPTHRWCKQRSCELLEEALTSTKLQSFALVGTGKSFATLTGTHPKVHLMERATALGLRTRVIFLHCPLDVARARNASRPRSLPDEVIVSSMESSRRLFELLRDVCDVSEEHDTRKHQPSRKGRRASLAEVAVTSLKIQDSVHRIM
jgi:predicted kinase